MDASRPMATLGHSFKERFGEVKSAYWMRAAQKEQAATRLEMFSGTNLFLSLSFDPVDPVSSPLPYLWVWVCCPRLQQLNLWLKMRS